MPSPKSDEDWALWCERYVLLAREEGVHAINQKVAERTGRASKGVATTVDRMRARGFLTPYVSRTTIPALTPEAQRIVDAVHRRRNAKVAFTLEVAANSKAEALAEVWDVVQQLEHWDDRSGQPFVYQPARMQRLGSE